MIIQLRVQNAYNLSEICLISIKRFTWDNWRFVQKMVYTIIDYTYILKGLIKKEDMIGI